MISNFEDADAKKVAVALDGCGSTQESTHM
jgi:hypothetical protein